MPTNRERLIKNNQDLNTIKTSVHNLPDTSDATATASDIVKDKTAYVNGIKLLGTLENIKMMTETEFEQYRQQGQAEVGEKVVVVEDEYMDIFEYMTYLEKQEVYSTLFNEISFIDEYTDYSMIPSNPMIFNGDDNSIYLLERTNSTIKFGLQGEQPIVSYSSNNGEYYVKDNSSQSNPVVLPCNIVSVSDICCEQYFKVLVKKAKKVFVNYDDGWVNILDTGAQNWEDLGFEGSPVIINNMYNNATDIMENVEPDAYFDAYYEDNTDITIFPRVDTSSTITMRQTFKRCTNLLEIAPIDMSSVTNTEQMFYGCTNLKYFPEIEAQNCTVADDMFSQCTNLSDESLNNILYFCIHSNMSNKHISRLGISSDQIQTIQYGDSDVFTNLQDFYNAGWELN